MNENPVLGSSVDSTTHAGIPQMMGKCLAHYGVDSSQLFAAAAIDLERQQTGEGRVSSRAMQGVWRAAVEATGDEAFGLTFAQLLHPAALHGLGFACAVSDTMHDAFNRIVRYYRMIATAGEIVVSVDQDRLRLLYQIPGPPGIAVAQSLDAALALFLQLCRITKDETYCPVLVEMQRPAPEDTSPFDSFFGCSIKYGCAENSLYFSLETLNQPLPMGNSELARASDEVIIEYMRRCEEGDIVGKVRARMIDWLPEGTPSQDSIAKVLHMSARTLQRKLGESGESFSQLLENVRSDLARQYLASPTRSIGEIAYLLGFTEPANFSRSFKRWTGLTPAQFRAAT